MFRWKIKIEKSFINSSKLIRLSNVVKMNIILFYKVKKKTK